MARILLSFLLIMLFRLSGYTQPGGTANYKPVAIATPVSSFTDAGENTRLVEVERIAKLRLQARQDARQYYKPRGVFLGTMGTTIVYPAAGLVTGVVVAAVPPGFSSGDNPRTHLLHEPEYVEAYKKQAHRKRFTSAAAGVGAGVVVLGIIARVAAGGL